MNKVRSAYTDTRNAPKDIKSEGKNHNAMHDIFVKINE